MTAAKEIRSKIGSIKSTQKITRAMEMISAGKMRKAQERMVRSRPYADKIRQVISHLASAHPEYKHSYLNVRPRKRAGFMIVTSDRGLCGGLNSNLLKTALAEMKTLRDAEVEIDLCLIGNKAEAFFKRFGGRIVAEANHLGDAPKIENLIGIVKVMLDSYNEGTLDSLHIVYNEFISTMSQKPRILQLLPIVAEMEPPETPADKLAVKNQTEAMSHHWDYIYEPDARALLTLLLERYVESQVYQAVIENIACEQAARMVAMKNATESAGDLISNLQLAYNKARQAAITRELAEIVAGAAAV